MTPSPTLTREGGGGNCYARNSAPSPVVGEGRREGSLRRIPHQARGRGARLGRDGAAGEHAGDFLAALGGSEFLDQRDGTVVPLALCVAPVMGGLGGDLR